MKKIIAIVTLFFLFSCINKNEIELEINNNQLISFEYQRLKLLNGEIKSYNNEIKILLKNGTEKKYLFLLKDYYLSNLTLLKVNVYRNKKILKESFVNHDPSGKEAMQYMKHEDSIYLNIEKLENEALQKGMKRDKEEIFYKFDNQKIIVNSGEKCDIKTNFSLPIINNELFSKYSLELYYSLTKGNTYEVEFVYEVKKGYVESFLSKNQLDSLKNNNVEIFSGVLKTNRIPIVIK